MGGSGGIRNKSAGLALEGGDQTGWAPSTTAIALIVIVDSKFLEGAWIIVLLVPLILLMFAKIRQHYLRAPVAAAQPAHGGLGDWLPLAASHAPQGRRAGFQRCIPARWPPCSWLRTMSGRRHRGDGRPRPHRDGTAAAGVARAAFRGRSWSCSIRLNRLGDRAADGLSRRDRPPRAGARPRRRRAAGVRARALWQNLLHKPRPPCCSRPSSCSARPRRAGNRIVIDVPYRLRSAA